MSCISVVKQHKKHLVEPRQESLWALGAAIGGLAEKAVFDVVRQAVGETSVELIQSILLAVVTLLTLIIYSTKLVSEPTRFPIPLLAYLLDSS